jgi:hypothetical protein
MDAFIRIQKAGSTSLKKSLHNSNDIIMLEHAYSYPIGNIQGWVWRGDIETDIWNNEFPNFDKNKFNKLFALVRNPFEILISYYYHSNKNYSTIDGWGNCNKVHGFKSWEDFLDSYIDPLFEWHIPQMKQSMFSFIYDINGDIIIDDFFKLEEIDKLNDFLIKNKLPSMGMENVTPNKNRIKKHYTKEQIIKLSNIWETDLKYFSYEPPIID